MPYYEVANLVTVTKTNMIDEMPCAMVTVGHNAMVFVYNRIPTDREETAKLRSEGYMQHDALYWRRAWSKLPPGCL